MCHGCSSGVRGTSPERLLNSFELYLAGTKRGLVAHFFRLFCAIDPSLRMVWAKPVSRLLKPEREPITLLVCHTVQILWWLYFWDSKPSINQNRRFRYSQVYFSFKLQVPKGMFGWK